MREKQNRNPSQNDWNTLSDVIPFATDEVTDYSKCQNQVWFSENSEAIKHLISEKRVVCITFEKHSMRSNKK